MKKIFILRHAKSCWKRDLPDHLRPLNERGVRNAHEFGYWLNENTIDPKVILCSNAVRTQETFHHLSKVATYIKDIPFELHENLYHASLETHLDYINRYQDPMIIGHNNGLNELTRYLTMDDSIELKTAHFIELVEGKKRWKINREFRPVKGKQNVQFIA